MLFMAIASGIPGIKDLINPLINSVFSLFSTFFGKASGWLVLIVKIIIHDHVVLIKNLFSTRRKIDPSEEIEDINRRGRTPVE